MKQHFIIKNNQKHLLLFFAGWGMDETPFLQIRPTNKDWLICYDYRSFLSYPRHEYFRRTLCNLVGRDVENGEIPISEMERVNQMIEDISYNNAKNFFKF